MGCRISYGKVERIFIAALGEGPVAPGEWEAYLAALGVELATLSGLLLFSAGGSLNAKQREQMAEVAARGNLRVAVLTDSRVVRGTVTALRWSELPIEAFACDEEARALDYLHVAAGARGAVLGMLSEVMVRVPSTVKLRAVRQRQQSGARNKVSDGAAPGARNQRTR